MAQAHDRLHASCCSMAADGAAKPSWTAVQAEGQNICVAAPSSSDLPLLDSIINTSLALDRSPAASQVCFSKTLVLFFIAVITAIVLSPWVSYSITGFFAISQSHTRVTVCRQG